MKFLIFEIKKNQIQKKDYFLIKSFKRYPELLIILEKLGFIRSFTFEKNLGFTVVLKYYNGYSLITNLTTYKYTFKKSNITKKKLLLLLKKNPSSDYILNTPVGLMSHQDSLRLNIFGVLLLKVN